MINQKLMWILPPILVAATSIGTTQVRGWDGPWGGYDNGPWQSNNQPICGAYCAGQTDAIYDHQNQLQYQPYGQCLSCHSQEYWNSFRQGYDQQWNSYQSQEIDQGAAVNVYGNNNAPITVNQYSNQQQNPLQQLARTFCGFINCNQPPPQPQQTSWGP